MHHPELIYLASSKCHVPIERLIYDAFVYEERMVCKRKLYAVHQLFIHGVSVPEFIEDYALRLLADCPLEIGNDPQEETHAT